MIKIDFYFLTHKPHEKTFVSEIQLESLYTDEPLMNLKLRIAVQASEYHKRNISAYDFVLALAQKESFEIKTLIDDEKVATFRQLEWNPN